jgi:hypothetical protein
MGRMVRRLALAALFAALLSPSRAEAQQTFGNKVMGTLGLDAGVQIDPGVYAADLFFWYSANHVVGANGHTLAIPLDLDVFANGFGANVVWKLRGLGTYLNASVSWPLARVRANTDRPEASIDEFGLGDLYVQPLRLGWRLPYLDLVTGYAFYAPTGGFAPGGHDGVGRGEWSQEFSLGNTIWFDSHRDAKLSFLASYNIPSQKLDVQVTRGQTLQIQGGVGFRPLQLLQVGAVGYALVQTNNDHGADLPPALNNSRDRALGAGLEAGVDIPSLRSRVIARYAHDVIVRARPEGQILLVQWQVNVWRPRAR